MSDRVEVRTTPTDRDLDRMVEAGKRAVAELVMTMLWDRGVIGGGVPRPGQRSANTAKGAG